MTRWVLDFLLADTRRAASLQDAQIKEPGLLTLNIKPA